MGIFSKWCGQVEQEAEQVTTEKNEIWMRLSVSRKGDNVCIEMHGLEKVNVCLASFLTKGVSYAQEKYNEYKQSPKDIEPIEEPKADTRTKREPTPIKERDRGDESMGEGVSSEERVSNSVKGSGRFFPRGRSS